MSSAEATLCAQLPREAQKTLYSILSRVALPSEADEKYRTLRLDNAALQQRLLRHDGALELLALCRFELRGRFLVLPAEASCNAIHRALDAITAAAAPAAGVYTVGAAHVRGSAAASASPGTDWPETQCRGPLHSHVLRRLHFDAERQLIEQALVHRFIRVALDVLDVSEGDHSTRNEQD